MHGEGSRLRNGVTPCWSPPQDDGVVVLTGGSVTTVGSDSSGSDSAGSDSSGSNSGVEGDSDTALSATSAVDVWTLVAATVAVAISVCIAVVDATGGAAVVPTTLGIAPPEAVTPVVAGAVVVPLVVARLVGVAWALSLAAALDVGTVLVVAVALVVAVWVVV